MSAYQNIPTIYKGINFRSRLEAKYACVFDQLGWKWEYEPVDFKGWIPDFVIRGVNPIFVEIKPVWNIDEVQDVGREIVAALGLDADEGQQHEDPKGSGGVLHGPSQARGGNEEQGRAH